MSEVVMYSKEDEYEWLDFVGIFTAFIKMLVKKCVSNPMVLAQLLNQNSKHSPSEALHLATKLLKKNKEKAKKQYPEICKKLATNSLFVEAAIIAKDVYRKGSLELRGGWKRSAEFPDLLYCDANDTGLVSVLYSRSTKGTKEYIYATAGTDAISPRDWQNNFYQICGDSFQYQLALQNARQLSDRISKSGGTLIFVGHSLGGGIAINNALATHQRAIVFNPAGLSDETKAKSQIDTSSANESNLVDVFLADNDILNLIQDLANEFDVTKLIVPSTQGERLYLKTSDATILSHSMDSIITAMERYDTTEKE